MNESPAADLSAARDRMAMAVSAGAIDVDASLGSLTLRAHQRTAVARLLEIMSRYRGALLADAVGLGKTYVALAVAREHARPLVICPAALRPMWERATRVAHIPVPIMTIESLARGERPSVDPDVVLVDEAHHFRTPKTRRYQHLACLAIHARLLLLSATPFHNRRRDLTAVLALFLGSDVHAWSNHDLGRVIVRRDESSANQALPSIVGPHPLSPGADDDCLDAICSLPLAVPAADEGTAGALAVISMVHLWASSRAALLGSLRKRRARAVALREAIATGQLPTSGELAAWHCADDSVQMAFPFCVTKADHPIDVVDLAQRLDAYVRAVSAVIDGCRLSPDPDEARASLLRTLRTTHPGTRIVGFSQYARTVAALGRLLRDDAGVAVITAGGARIASGPIPRQEILAQFAGDASVTPVVERVDLLLSTDLLSEGVDLRGASVIVHLDLPWNPARLEQRVGRARRLGSSHNAIHVYTFVPPAAAERMLSLERRLGSKIRAANDSVGGAAPLFALNVRDLSRIEPPIVAAEHLRAHLAHWIDPMARRDSSELSIAGATAPCNGWLAVVFVDRLPRLIHCVDDAVAEDPAEFSRLAEQLDDACPVDVARVEHALAQIESWVGSRQLASEIGFSPGSPSERRAVLDRLSLAVARAPRHRRTKLLVAVQQARDALSRLTGAGVERVLAELARSATADDAWIQSVQAFAALHSSGVGATTPAAPTIGALILLTAKSSAAAAALPSTHWRSAPDSLR